MKNLMPFIVLGVIATGLLAYSGLRGPVGAASPGPYQMAAQPTTGNSWVLDTASGQVRHCKVPQERTSPPNCTPWTE